MLKPSRRRWFVMPPAEAAPVDDKEQKQFVDVYAVLRDHVAYAAAIRSEVRQLRREHAEQKQELAMKVSELSSKVDTLISVATDLKGRVDSGSTSPGSPVASQPAEDDPEVERLAHRIDDAIAVLKGEKNAGGGMPPANPGPNPFDPNAPAEPSPEALATDINSPQARDPNAPV